MLQMFVCLAAPASPLKQLVAHGDYSSIANCWNKKSPKRNFSSDIWNFSGYLKISIYLFILGFLAEPQTMFCGTLGPAWMWLSWSLSLNVCFIDVHVELFSQVFGFLLRSDSDGRTPDAVFSSENFYNVAVTVGASVLVRSTLHILCRHWTEKHDLILRDTIEDSIRPSFPRTVPVLKRSVPYVAEHQ